MAYKKSFLFTIFFISGILLFAQVVEADKTSDEAAEEELFFYLDRSGKEPRFIQRLIWEHVDYVLRYVVIIEQLGRDNRFIEVEKAETKNTFLEISLIAGKYRYRVEVYDLFDELANTTRWHEFEILRAVQPNVTGFSPQSFYLDEDEEWVITVRGRNFMQNTEFFLVQNNLRIRSQKVTVEGNTAIVEFSGSSLSLGEYAVYARNPGGLDDSLKTFTITNKKPFDVNISLSYAPVIPVSGFLFQEFEYNESVQDAPFPDGIYPLGATLKVSYLPFKRVWGNLGAELSGSFAYLSHDRVAYTTSVFLINGYASVLYQKHFFKRTFFINVSVGVGLFSLLDFTYDFGGSGEPGKGTFTFISINGGLSFTYMFKKPFFATIGLDFAHAFSPAEDNPQPNVFRPFIAVGIQL